MSTAVEKVNGSPVASREPGFDPRALAEAAAIRTKAEADAEAARIKAQGEARAAATLASEQAEELRLANERKRMRLEKDQVDHKAHVARKNTEAAKARAEEKKTEQAAADKEAAEAKRDAEQLRSERVWKWGARGIYAVGLIIAAPVQFMHFWDPERKFLVAAPALLEGNALVLAAGAAWAVAHRRDVLRYRIGIVIGALIAAAINLYGGKNDPEIGMNAGIIGAIASLGGPIVLMAYEHGIAQKADGIPSRRETRAAKKAAEKDAAEKARAKAEREAAAKKAAGEKADQQKRAEAEQKRRDADREDQHPEVWEVAEKLRSARGSAAVTEQIWGDAWYLVTGSKRVGIDADIEADARAAQARMKAATEGSIIGDSVQVESQKGRGVKRDPDAPDGRRFNGGTPPRRTAGDTEPYSPLAKKQAAVEQAATSTARDSSDA